jgi:two-component system chemotaxis sensor kinase CheA
MVEGREVMTLRGATLPICRLDVLFGLPRTSVERRFVVVSAVGARRIGFVVDVLSGQQDIVIKSLGKSLSKVRGFAGATDLGDQRVALVIDAPGLLEEVLSTADLIAKREAVS